MYLEVSRAHFVRCCDRGAEQDHYDKPKVSWRCLRALLVRQP